MALPVAADRSIVSLAIDAGAERTAGTSRASAYLLPHAFALPPGAPASVRAGAAGDSAELAAALAQHLAGYGHAQVHEHGRYWKIPEYLEFSVELAPQGTADECVTALRAIDPAGWSDDVWNRRPDGPALWHPSVCWASIWSQEAATPPPFADGDVVIILDCPTARRERIVDAEAVVCGHAAPVVDARPAQWSFAVRLDSGDTFMLSESELVATGRRATGGTAPTWISVTPDGQVTGFSTPSEH